MRLLNRTDVFREWFTTESGLRFRGTMAPLTDGNAQTTTFLEPRHVFLTRREEPVRARDIIHDQDGSAFLLANHDITPHRRTFRVFQMQGKLPWRRQATVTEPITGLTKSITETNLGDIWCASELYGREEVDRGLKVGIDRKRLITGAAVQLNDKVDGLTISRLTLVYGVSVVEVT